MKSWFPYCIPSIFILEMNIFTLDSGVFRLNVFAMFIHQTVKCQLNIHPSNSLTLNLTLVWRTTYVSKSQCSRFHRNIYPSMVYFIALLSLFWCWNAWFINDCLAINCCSYALIWNVRVVKSCLQTSSIRMAIDCTSHYMIISLLNLHG